MTVQFGDVLRDSDSGERYLVMAEQQNLVYCLRLTDDGDPSARVFEPVRHAGDVVAAHVSWVRDWLYIETLR